MEKQSNKDLLQLERGTNSLEERLRVTQESSSDAKPRMPTTSVPESNGVCLTPINVVPLLAMMNVHFFLFVYVVQRYVTVVVFSGFCF